MTCVNEQPNKPVIKYLFILHLSPVDEKYKNGSEEGSEGGLN